MKQRSKSMIAYTRDWQSFMVQLREEIFGTQKLAAESMDIPRDRIEYLEHRKKFPNREYMAALALQCTIREPEELRAEKRRELLAHINSLLNSASVPQFLDWNEVSETAMIFLKGKRPLTKKSALRFEDQNELSVDSLIWACNQITEHNVRAFESKHIQRLYLQRESVFRALQNFLVSDKKVFVLIGKSGVGKSNFVLSLPYSFPAHFIIFEGAYVDIEQSLVEFIASEFAGKLGITGISASNFFQQVDSLTGIDKVHFVLLIDAINENSKADLLLRQIDELAREQHPWLKIVITSRPETWKTIKRGLRLADGLYYRQANQDEPFIELGPFEHSEKLLPFFKNELPEVYEKYKQQFLLKTPYEELPGHVRDIISDPLNLYMVAHTYRGDVIPRFLSVDTMIGFYIEALIKRGSLSIEDLRYVKRQIVPLMTSMEKSMITETDLDSLNLYSEIFENGRTSLENLLNAEIIDQRTQVEITLAFKYERFYEYFVGGHVYELSKKYPQRFNYFYDQIKKALRKPFLWGVVRNALVMETEENGFSILEQLCFYNHTELPTQRIREMLSSVITIIGERDRNLITKYLKQLIAQQGNAQRRLAHEVVAEVALNLQLSDSLYRLCKSDDDAIQTLAINFAYCLFQREKDAGISVLDKLGKDVGLLHHASFKGFFYLSCLIFFDNSKDQQILKQLQMLWQSVLNRAIPGIQFLSRSDTLSVTFISTFTSIIERMVQLSSVASKVNVDTVKTPQESSHELYERLIGYLDPNLDCNLNLVTKDFLEAVKDPGFTSIMRPIAVQGLLVQGMRSPEEMRDIMRHILEIDPFNSCYMSYIAEMMSKYRPDIDWLPEFLESCGEFCEQFYQNDYLPRSRTENPYNFYWSPCMPLSSIVHCRINRQESVISPYIRERIEIAIQEEDLVYFEHLVLKTHLPELGISYGYPYAALDILEMFFDCDNPAIQQMIATFLGQLRIYYPDPVDDFLEIHRVSSAYRTNLIHEYVEPGEAQIMAKAIYFLSDEIVKATSISKEISNVLLLALECRNAHEWLVRSLNQLFKIIYNSSADS